MHINSATDSASSRATDEDCNSLVVRARNGCEMAYEELVRRYFPRLVHLVLPRINAKSHMDAEDIAQETLARAFLKIESFDPQFRFSTWLYTIALRIATDHNRGYRRRLSLLETHRTLLADSLPLLRSATERLEQSENVDNLWQIARRELTEAQYTAMWLRFSEELSVEEVARVMRKTQVGVRVLLHRARLKMLSQLNREDACDSVRTLDRRGS